MKQSCSVIAHRSCMLLGLLFKWEKQLNNLKKLKKKKKLKKFCYLFVFEKKSLLNRPQLGLIKNGRKKTKEERKKVTAHLL